MLTTPISLTVNTDTLAFERVNQDNFASTYFAKSADGLRHYSLEVKHSLPTSKSKAEQHTAKLDVKVVDAEGTHLRSASIWVTMRTHDAVQDDALLEDMFVGTSAWLQASTNEAIGRILLRES